MNEINFLLDNYINEMKSENLVSLDFNSESHSAGFKYTTKATYDDGRNDTLSVGFVKKEDESVKEENALVRTHSSASFNFRKVKLDGYKENMSENDENVG